MNSVRMTYGIGGRVWNERRLGVNKASTACRIINQKRRPMDREATFSAFSSLGHLMERARVNE